MVIAFFLNVNVIFFEISKLIFSKVFGVVLLVYFLDMACISLGAWSMTFRGLGAWSMTFRGLYICVFIRKYFDFEV